MTATARNRLIAVAALLVAGGGLAFIAAGSMGDNLVYYWSPKELTSQGDRAFGPTIRLGGVVKPGSVQWNDAHTTLTFQVAESRAPDAVAVTVKSTEIPPQMFRDGIGVVVEGTYDKSQIFNSSRLMVNHSNEYKAPHDPNDPSKWRDTLSEPQASARP